MNAFLVFDYLKKKHKRIIKTEKLRSIEWTEVFASAKHSVFICGGEMRTLASSKVAKDYYNIFSGKLSSNSEFNISVLCGSWLYAEKQRVEPTGEAPAINATLKKLHELAKEKPESNISFYLNQLNVAESTETGYLHNVIIDEGTSTQRAFIEVPHGCPKKDSDKHDNNIWISSSDEEFVRDIINTRETFRVHWGIKMQPAAGDSVFDEIANMSIESEDFYRVTKNWNYRSYFAFVLCLKRWLSGKIVPPSLPILPAHK